MAVLNLNPRQFIGPKPPMLTPADKISLGVKTINFQFRPIDFTVDCSSAWASATTIGRQNPIIMFTSGNLRRYQFVARLWAETMIDNIDEQLAALQNAVEADFILKRPPLWIFTWGKIIHDTVIVESIGGIKYDELRNDGSARGITCQVTLLRYTQTDINITDPNKPPPSTFYVEARTEDQWESIAAREYGDPLIGDLLRRMNPALPFPGGKPGTVLALLPAARFRGVDVEPYSGPLQRTPTGLALRAAWWAKRSNSRPSTVLK